VTGRAARGIGKVRVYGPVPSRRLGFSLGVDLLPFKTCSMDCVYCQLGSQGRTTVRRREFVPVRTILAQIRAALAKGKPVDAITFSGSGEPTLHSGLGRIIAGIRRLTDVKVVLLTNSSSLTGARARRDAAAADIVVPSLDAATPGVFAKINRPHAGLTVEKTINGLIAFRREFKGRIWLEIMLVKGVNDGPAHLRALKKAIARIRPDRVQLNTVVRPPAEKNARPLTRQELEAVREALGGEAEIIADFAREKPMGAPADPAEAIAGSSPAPDDGGRPVGFARPALGGGPGPAAPDGGRRGNPRRRPRRHRLLRARFVKGPGFPVFFSTDL
jgi:wyosine [tRNA(Phe)-imidazoG37] synthetase (radical SAM superfamily)